METIKEIFTGEGGTTRLIIVGLVAIGLVNAITEKNYEVNSESSNGNTFTIRPGYRQEKTDDDPAITSDENAELIPEEVAAE